MISRKARNLGLKIIKKATKLKLFNLSIKYKDVWIKFTVYHRPYIFTLTVNSAIPSMCYYTVINDTRIEPTPYGGGWSIDDILKMFVRVSKEGC